MRRVKRSKQSVKFTLGTMLIVLASLFVLYAGCSSGEETETNPATSSSDVTAVGPGGPCFGNDPDGLCIANGPAEENCECPDCITQAKCSGGCNDDGNCDIGDGRPEDCSCNDCYFIVPQCSPGTGDCNFEDQGCQADEPCTCSDCTDTPGCNNCVDNGVCNRVFEGCNCADCASANCGMSGPGPGPGPGPGGGGPGGMGGMPTTTNGGMGGVPMTNGGMGGTPTTTNGGMGGMGGN